MCVCVFWVEGFSRLAEIWAFGLGCRVLLGQKAQQQNGYDMSIAIVLFDPARIFLKHVTACHLPSGKARDPNWKPLLNLQFNRSIKAQGLGSHSRSPDCEAARSARLGFGLGGGVLDL